MGNREMGIIETLGANIERVAGTSVRDKVMEGRERLTEKSGKVETAGWVKGAMERLDKAVSKDKRTRIREACGRACAETNKSVIERAKAKRRKFKSDDDLIANELRRPLTGTRLEKRGNVLHQVYMPRSFSTPMRCFCSLANGLPESETMSSTYCLCGQGFAQRYWEAVFGRPVEVRLLESCLTGAAECKFAIRP